MRPCVTGRALEMLGCSTITSPGVTRILRSPRLKNNQSQLCERKISLHVLNARIFRAGS
uniref:Uncharacterized protein n=1 Tax=Anguilla anguilla TaxID=7936 RepID=A0A0E9VAU7_ANGAN